MDKSILERLSSKYAFEIVDQLISAGKIDKSIFIEHKDAISNFNINIPFYLKNKFFLTTDYIREKYKKSNLSYDNISEYIDKKNWRHLFTSEFIVWDEQLLNQYNDQIDWTGASKSFSSATNVKWTRGIFATYLKILHLEILCKNKSIDWTDELIELLNESQRHVRFGNLWNYLSSGGSSVKWSDDLIKKYENSISFPALSRNQNVNWTIPLIDKYITKWDWEKLSGNPNLPWSPYFLIRYEEKFNWKWGFPTPSETGTSISTNSGIHWTLELIELFIDKIDLFEISQNANIDEAVLFKYTEKFNNLRVVGYEHHKYSDWHYSNDVFSVPWEALADNQNFEFSYRLLFYLSKIKTKKIIYEGDVSKEIIVNCLNYLKYCKIKRDDVLNVLNSNLLTYFVNTSKEKLKRPSGSHLVRVQPFINKSIWIVLQEYFDDYLNLKNFLLELESVPQKNLSNLLCEASKYLPMTFELAAVSDKELKKSSNIYIKRISTFQSLETDKIKPLCIFDWVFLAMNGDHNAHSFLEFVEQNVKFAFESTKDGMRSKLKHIMKRLILSVHDQINQINNLEHLNYLGEILAINEIHKSTQFELLEIEYSAPNGKSFDLLVRDKGNNSIIAIDVLSIHKIITSLSSEEFKLHLLNIFNDKLQSKTHELKEELNSIETPIGWIQFAIWPFIWTEPLSLIKYEAVFEEFESSLANVLPCTTLLSVSSSNKYEYYTCKIREIIMTYKGEKT